MTKRNVVQFRITDEELKELRSRCGKSLSEYMRSLVFGKDAVLHGVERAVMPSGRVEEKIHSKNHIGVMTGAPRAVEETRECGFCQDRGWVFDKNVKVACPRCGK